MAKTSTAITITILAGHAAEIRRLGKRVIADVIEIGRLLAECKRICGHGDWLTWLDHEFGWSVDTAERFIQVSALANEIPQVAEFAIPISGLYLLAAPSTPPEARDAIIERAEAGESVPVAEVKQAIETAKDRKQPARKPATAFTAKPRPAETPLSRNHANASEIKRLRARVEELQAENRRLEIENVGLRSEIEELRACLPSGDPGPVPASCRRPTP
jgi:Protein of unknown function (DUF3102)